MGDREQIKKNKHTNKNQNEQKKATWKKVKAFSRIRDNMTPMKKE